MKETKFKQTEVGMIPCDWEVKSLGEISNGFSYGVGAEAISFNGKDKYIRITDIDDTSNKFVPHPLSSPAFYSEKDIVQSDDILFARTGASVGKSYVYDKKDGRLIFAGFLMKLHIRDANSKFVFYQTLTNRYKSWIVSESMRTGQPGINLEQIKKYFLLLPQIEEQKHIAQALSDVDAVISTTEKLIAKKKVLKQGTMQQLLTGKVRLGFQTKDERRKTSDFTCHSGAEGDRIQGKYKMTELGLIPEDWRVKRLGDEVILSTETFESAQYKKEFYVGTENMLQDKAGITKNETVNPIGKAKGFKRNDILMSNIRPYLKKIWYANRDGICSNDVLVYRVAKNAIDSSFLYSILSDDKFFAYVIENAVGTKMPRGDKKIIREYLFACPPTKEEQTSIATVLSDMDSEIAALEIKLAKYRQLKTGMMQQLLTGKVRLV